MVSHERTHAEEPTPRETWSEFRDFANAVISACPVRVYAASYKVTPYPYLLNNVDEANYTRAGRSSSFVLDSKIMDGDVGNEDVLETAVKFAGNGAEPDYVVPADVLHEQETTTERVVDFLRKWEPLYEDGVLNSKPLIPLQPEARTRGGTLEVSPTHDKHFADLYPRIEEWVERHDLRYWLIGGVAKAGPEVQVEALRRGREAVPDNFDLHGLGMGASMDVVRYIREEVPVTSVDFSTTSQNVRFGQVLNKHLKKEDFYYLTGDYASFINGMIEYAQLLQINMALGPLCSDDLLTGIEQEPADLREDGQGGLEEWAQ